ncbi:MAG: tetratricopeptide repeat protein [Fuerstiella sp.]
MSQNPPVLPVKGGPPLWLWGMLLVATAAVVVGVIASGVPDDPADLYQQALQQLNSGSKAEFEQSLNRLKQFPEYSDHVILLEGIKAAGETRDPKAVEFFEQAQKNAELKPLALQKAGESLTRMGQFREAIDRYEEAIRIGPENADHSRLLLARLYHAVGALTLAETTLDEIIAGDGTHTGARQLRAQVRTDLSRFAEALADYSATLVTPGDVASASPGIITNYATCMLSAEDTEKMADFVKQHLPMINEESLRARLLFQTGDLGGAEALIAAAPAERGPQPEFLILQAQIALVNGEPEIAEKVVLEALERMPRNARFFQVAVAVFKETGDSEKLDVAEQNLHQLEDLQKQLFDALTVVGDNIDDVDGRFRVAELLAKLGRFPKAQQWFLTGGAIDPERGDDAQKQMEEHLRVVLPLVGFADDNPPETPADSNKGEARPEDNVNAETNGTKTEATPEGTSKADESQSGVKLNVAPPESKKKEDGSESP